MRFGEFNTRSDEALPALGKMVKGLGAVAGAAKQVAGAATSGNKPQGVKPQGVKPQGVAAKQAQQAQAKLSKQLLKKGSSIPFPTQSGQAKEFKIDDVKGDEVTIINPDARAKPEEPEKMVYKKQDVETVVKGLQQ
jgi:hypothetical protein